MVAKPAMKYNPAFLTEEELIRNFVVRHKDLELLLEVLRENESQNNQHILVVAPRGAGKPTLVLRVASEIRRNKDFSEKWYPVVFSEESYRVCTAGEFWLEAIFQIGQQTKIRSWKNVYEDLRKESDEDRLRERALSQLMDFADARNRRLLLVVESLSMIFGQQISSNDAWKLRHTLQNESRIMILGTAVSRFDQLDNSEKAMFELFRIQELEPLNTNECRRLWESVTTEQLDLNRIRPLRILTGGNPRLLFIISSFVAKNSFKELMQNLTRLVDEHTEYFKSHLDNLPAQERKVFITLADIWNPATAKEIADFARIGVNKVSAHLQRLMSKGAVVVAERKGGKKWYQVAERMYNIYHLMRRRGTPVKRVRAVVNFMVSFYEPEAVFLKAVEIVPENQWAWGGMLQRKLFEKLAPPNVVLKLAEERIRKYPASAALHNSAAWIFFKNAPRSYLSKARVWANRAVELDPENSNYGYTLASILAVTGEPEESLQHAQKYMMDRGVVRSTLEDWIDLFVNIAAAGCPHEALEVLQASSGADLIEPLIIGLRLFIKEEVKAPVEVQEVAMDVKKRIEEQREKINSENAL